MHEYIVYWKIPWDGLDTQPERFKVTWDPEIDFLSSGHLPLEQIAPQDWMNLYPVLENEKNSPLLGSSYGIYSIYNFKYFIYWVYSWIS